MTVQPFPRLQYFLESETRNTNTPVILFYNSSALYFFYCIIKLIRALLSWKMIINLHCIIFFFREHDILLM